MIPCCMSDSNDVVGFLQNNSLGEIYNSQRMKDMRLQMLKGEKPKSCSRCFELENSGNESYRSFMNKRFGHHFQKVNETTVQGEAKAFLPYWDIRFSNVCNFRCRTCALPLSSGWYEDEKHFNSNPGLKYRKVIDHANDLWAQLEPHLSELEEIYFVGGEPMLMEEHWQILETLVKRQMFHVRLRYNTNFSHLTYKDLDAVPLWNQFRRVEIQASLDGFGERGEYLRKGQNWSQAVANRRRLMSEAPRVRFTVNSTVSIFNWLHLPDFHRQWIEEGLIKADGFLFNPLIDPSFYSVKVLPPPLKAQVEEKIEFHLYWLQKVAEEPAFLIAKGRYASMIQFMNSEDRQDLIPRFLERTLALDVRRNEKFAKVFPEIAKIQFQNP